MIHTKSVDCKTLIRKFFQLNKNNQLMSKSISEICAESLDE